jgi:hypothetical protein
MSTSTTTTSYFYESDVAGSKPLTVTNRKYFAGDRPIGAQRGGILQPHGLMSATHLQHQGEMLCHKLVVKARTAGIPDISGYQAKPGKSITTRCGLRLTVLDKDGKPQLIHLLVQCLKPWYATANKLPESPVYFALTDITSRSSQIKTLVRTFIVSELEDDSLPSVQAMLKGHHVHVDYLQECLQALQTCIQSFQRVRTPNPRASAPRATCLDTDMSAVKLEAMVKEGMDFAALVEHNDGKNVKERRANRQVIMAMAKILGVSFQPQVSESGQSVCIHCTVLSDQDMSLVQCLNV